MRKLIHLILNIIKVIATYEVKFNDEEVCAKTSSFEETKKLEVIITSDLLAEVCIYMKYPLIKRMGILVRKSFNNHS